MFSVPPDQMSRSSPSFWICTVCAALSNITRTCLYNVDPLEPNFYIVKLGFIVVYIIFLFLLKNIDCGYALEPPRRKFSDKNSDIFHISAQNIECGYAI